MPSFEDQVVEENDFLNGIKVQNFIKKTQNKPVNITGVCKNCGDPIDDKRLAANPKADLCIDCATELENKRAHSAIFGPKR